MTVENQTYKVVAEGNGSGFSFSFSPMVLPTDEDDLEVTLTDADGADTTLTRGSGASNYSVSVSSFPGTGSITYPADSSTALPSGQYLTMKRVLVLEQTQDIENQGGYSPETLETTLDKLVMIALQQQEELDFSFKTSLQDSTAIGRLPNAATRASKYLFFDASGDPTAVSSINNTAVSAFVETIIDDTSAAEVRTTIGAQEDVVTTRGDIVRGDSSGDAERLAVGAANTVLKSDGTDAAWGEVAVADLADGTDGELITWGSDAAPTTVAAGTSGQVLTSNGAGAAPTFQAAAGGGGMVGYQVFTSSDTYTKTAGATSCRVIVTGGGGSGGRASNASGAAGSGGSAGGTAIKFYADIDDADGATVTVGAGDDGAGGAGNGGDSTFADGATTVTGGGGVAGNDSSSLVSAAPTAGGTASDGDLNIPGGGGGSSDGNVDDQAQGGDGGASYWGGGGGGGYDNGGSGDGSGGDAGAYGAGGGGAVRTSSNYDGGAGAGGLVIVEEYA